MSYMVDVTPKRICIYLKLISHANNISNYFFRIGTSHVWQQINKIILTSAWNFLNAAFDNVHSWEVANISVTVKYTAPYLTVTGNTRTPCISISTGIKTPCSNTLSVGCTKSTLTTVKFEQKKLHSNILNDILLYGRVRSSCHNWNKFRPLLWWSL